MTLDELERVAERVRGLRTRAVPHCDAVDIVDAEGRYVAIGVPRHVADAVLAVPMLVAHVDRLERWAVVAIGCLDGRVKEAGDG